MSVILSPNKLNLKHRQKVGKTWVCSDDDDVFYYLTITLLKNGESQGVYYKDGIAYCVRVLDDNEVVTQTFDADQQDEIEAFFTYSPYATITELDTTAPFEIGSIAAVAGSILLLVICGIVLYKTLSTPELTQIVAPPPKKKIITVDVPNYNYNLTQRLISSLNDLIDKKGKAERWTSLKVVKSFRTRSDTRPRRLPIYVVTVHFEALYPYERASKRYGQGIYTGIRSKTVLIDPTKLEYERPSPKKSLEEMAKDPEVDVLSKWRFAVKTDNWSDFRKKLNEFASLSLTVDKIQIVKDSYYFEGSLLQ